MEEILGVLLSWAVVLSGYAMPAEAPEVKRVPHEFLVAQACNNRECKVLGWYAGGREIYIDERLDPEQNLFHSSIVLHEMVHYLQHEARRSDEHFSCRNALALEREAYGAQSQYLVNYGVYRPVGAAVTSATCVDDKRTPAAAAP